MSKDSIQIAISKDGIAREYDDTYDIVIHCETEEEQKEAIKKLNSFNGWIPVEERLPEPDHHVMLSFANASFVMIGRYTTDDDEGGAFMIGDIDESFLEHDLYTNAWMPLPEPYKED